MTLEPRYADDRLAIYAGDCRAVLAELPAESVHCVVTSPPYWALRDYGTASWEGGTDPTCDHLVGMQPPRSSRPLGQLHGGTATVDAQDAGKRARHVCPRCSAVRVDQQLGLEPTPEAYVQALVEIFRELRRVLRRDGTAWLNLGDSYAGSWGNQGRTSLRGTQRPINGPMMQRLGEAVHAVDCDLDEDCACSPSMEGIYPQRDHTGSWVKDHPTLKPKDLVGIPWRVAFALQADGWYLRRDVIWAKPNPMPESVEDRPTSAHEYVFLLSRSERYFYDHIAVRETGAGRRDLGRMTRPDARLGHGGEWHRDRSLRDETDRNLRSVWSIATEPYGGNHFATYPTRLVQPCVLAGTSAAGVCAECGAPWRRLVEPSSGGTRTALVDRRGARRTADTDLEQGRPPMGGGNVFATWRPPSTAGWEASCAHDAPTVPATVLDPFGGSGTTAIAAEGLGRRAVLIELNDEYIGQALKRVAGARYDREGHTVDIPIAPPEDSLWAALEADEATA